MRSKFDEYRANGREAEMQATLAMIPWSNDSSTISPVCGSSWLSWSDA